MTEWVRDETQPSGWRWTGDDPPQPSPRVEYFGHADHPGPSVTVDVPPRLDGWCEDRLPEDLSDMDGID